MASVADEKKLDSNVVSSVHDEHAKAVIPVTEERQTITLRQAIQGNGSVLWWSFFFALSAIGW